MVWNSRQAIIALVLALLPSVVRADTSIITSTRTVSVAPTVTAGAYSANDQVGGLLTFTDGLRDFTRTGVISSVVVVDKAAQAVNLELWLFNASITAVSDNAAADYTDADLANIACVIPIDTHYALADNGVSQATNINCVVDAASGGVVYGTLVTRGAPTYASTSDLTIKLGILQD